MPRVSKATPKLADRLNALSPEKRRLLAKRNPLAFAQQRLWFLDRLHGDSHFYNGCAVLGLHGKLRIDVLQRVIGEILRRHQVLRTALVEVDGDPLQLPIPPALPPVPVLDVSGLQAEVRDDERARLQKRETLRPFALDEPPLLRVVLVRMASDHYVLFATLHHIVTDRWSMSVLTHELGVLYAAYCDGKPSPLPELKLQFADFARWQRKQVEGERGRRQLEYWSRHLDGAPDGLDLPSDRPRPVRPTFRGGRRAVALPLQLGADLQEHCRRLGGGVTDFMVLMALYAILLYRHSGQRDLVVGYGVSGRPRPELEALIGLFVDTMVMRHRLTPDMPFARLLEQVRIDTLAGRENADVPLDRIVEEVRPERALAHNPLFQVSFGVQNAPQAEGLRLPGLRLEALDGSRLTAIFDLTLSIEQIPEPDGDGVYLMPVALYSAELFDATTMDRLLRHYGALLTAALKRPDCPLGALSLLTLAERHQLKVEWNEAFEEAFHDGQGHGEQGHGEQGHDQQGHDQEGRDLLDLTMQDLGRRFVPELPDFVAMVFGRQHLSLGALDARARVLAGVLRACGTGTDQLVGIALPRSLALAIAVRAVLEAGAAWVPLDADDPPERLAFILEDTHAPVVLTLSAAAAVQLGVPRPDLSLLQAGAAGTSTRVIELDASGAPTESIDRRALVPLPPLPQPPTCEADPLAFVIYTSGSTGRPKGAMNPQRATVNHTLWQIEHLGLGFDDRILHKGAFSFDVSVWELLLGPMVGATTVLARPGGHRDPRYLVRLIREQAVTLTHFVPSMMWPYLDHPDSGACRSLRQVWCGGETVPTELVQRFQRTLPDTQFFHVCGPTETAMQVVCLPCPPGESRSPVPLGWPMANIHLHVLDPRGRGVPIGIPGELCIGGEAVGRGYLGRPSLTAERFVPDPFVANGRLTQGGGRLYRTGDRCRHNRRGELEILGRLDHQVKLRGLRIEPGEIEAALIEHARVGRALVQLHRTSKEPAGDARLVAYVVPSGGAAPTIDELRAHLGSKLPEYMVPSAFLFLDAMPLHASGKIALGKLPSPDQAQTGAPEAEYVPPRGPLEHVIADVFSDVLHRTAELRVGAEDDFFDLGGHSLLATRAIARLREALGIEVPLATFFQAPTVVALAAQLEQLQRREQPLSAAMPALEPVPREPAVPGVEQLGRPVEPPPLSFGQQRLWLLDQLDPGSPQYNMPAAFELHGALDVRALERALRRVVTRQEALRTGFRVLVDGGEPVQQIEPVDQLSLELPCVDLGRLEPAAAESEQARLLAREARCPFDLSRPPLLRARLLRRSCHVHVLLLTVHHIVADGWSLGLLRHEIAVFYADTEARLPILRVQVGDFAAWQRRWLRGAVLDAEIAHWRQVLDGAPQVLELPSDRPRPAVQSLRGGSVVVRYSPDLRDGLVRLGRQSGSTLFITLLAAFFVLLRRQTGMSPESRLAQQAGSMDLLVGTPVANRRRRELEPLIGFFANTLVLRGDLHADSHTPSHGGPTFRELLARVRARALDAYAHQDVPFEKLVEELEPERDLARSPLFQVLFALQNLDPPKLEASAAAASRLGALTLQPLQTSSGTSKFDLNCSLAEMSDGLVCGLEYAADLFDAVTMRRLAEQFRVLLAAIVEAPGRRLGDLPWLAPGARHQLLREWAVPLLEGQKAPLTAPERFALVAAKAPHAIAVHASRGAASEVSAGRPDVHLSYRQLDAESGQLAVRLRAAGVAAEQVVAVLTPAAGSPALAVALLAVLRAGGIYMPLSVDDPPQRLAFLLQDAGVRHVVLAGVDAPQLFEVASRQGWDVEQLRWDGRTIDVEPGAAPSSPKVLPRTEILPQQGAYLLYTSGSTGQPKGVCVSHAALARLLQWQREALAAVPVSASESAGARTDRGRTLQFTAPTFDVSLQEMLSTLCSDAAEDRGGGTLVMPVPEVRIDPPALLSWLARYGVERLFVPVVLLRQLALAAAAGGAMPSSLRVVHTAGEALRVTPEVRVLFAGRPGVGRARLENQYGPTESHVVSRHSLAVNDSVENWPQLPPIGRPVPGSRLHVLDAHGQPVPAGVPGELSISGASLARGYHRRPALTAVAFVPGVPGGVDGVPGERCYRTGDLVRWHHDGTLAFVGRRDFQVKVRGIRLEPGEIETLLEGYSHVRQAAVYVQRAVPAQRDGAAVQLLAFVELVDGSSAALDTESLLDYLRQYLPAALLPSAFQVVERLPVNAHGKVDRRALAELAMSVDVGARSQRRAPGTETQRQLAGIWSEVLGREQIGLDDHFFRLGGHSLLATQVVSRIRQIFGVEVPLRRLFELPRLEDLAHSLESTEPPAPSPKVGEVAEGSSRQASQEASSQEEALQEARAKLFRTVRRRR